LDAIEWSAVAVDGRFDYRGLRKRVARCLFRSRFGRLALLGRETGFPQKSTDLYRYEVRQKAR